MSKDSSYIKPFSSKPTPYHTHTFTTYPLHLRTHTMLRTIKEAFLATALAILKMTDRFPESHRRATAHRIRKQKRKSKARRSRN